MSKIRWAPIFPLVGGFPLGAELATGNTPSYILSYDVAAFNDSLYNRYMNETRNLDIPFIRVDAEDFQPESLPEIDIAVATPFCSGLSMLSTSASRGSDSEVNKWIYESTEFCMRHTGAKVIVGENAPGLYSEMGEKLRKNLTEIASLYGYSTSFVKTSTIKHGIPQKRDRTFYFFWKSEYAPLFEWVDRKMIGYGEYMQQYRGGFDPAELEKKYKVVEEDVLYQFFKSQGYGFKDIQNMAGRTLLFNLTNNPEFGATTMKKFEKYADWLISMGATPENAKRNKSERSIYDTGLRDVTHWIDKYKQGKGSWDGTLIFVGPEDYTSALISKSTNTLVHPYEERTLTQKEKAHLMGMPANFNVEGFHENILNQNVPVNTAADMVRHAIKFLNGELQFSDKRYLMQNNMAQKTETSVETNNFDKSIALF
jgi:site-specific DNA-cytosine methylase